MKSQTEKDMDDKEKLMRQVLEKNKECKTLNNRLQEAKVKSLIYPKRHFHNKLQEAKVNIKIYSDRNTFDDFCRLTIKKVQMYLVITCKS